MEKLLLQLLANMTKTQKALLIITTITVCIYTNLNAQDKNGWRTHYMYFGTMISQPIGALNDYVPTGIGVKFGSSFIFSKAGFANGLINVGLKTEWINFEANVPYSKLGTDGEDLYKLAGAQMYGPQFSINPTTAVYIDLYYTPGWGFSMFPNSKAEHTDVVDPYRIHLRFAQSVGISLRAYAFYLGFNVQAHSNPDYENGERISNPMTCQITLGVCGWQNRK